jgi:hypothetical protein
VSEKGFTASHDDAHQLFELTAASISYAAHAAVQQGVASLNYILGVTEQAECWPWEGKWWKPSSDTIRDLVKAGALIAAEIDRLQRARLRWENTWLTTKSILNMR